MLGRRRVFNAWLTLRRRCSTLPLSAIRNLGVGAHIDAGKTTTTERMLYYCGFSRFLGNVDDGDTVMDYMQQERDRGITITSAAITFNWGRHRLNLIDTPGHVDFTVEVERAFRVMDGAITILDASAGVEAQSLTVWRQADRYDVPRIIYLNKMDKSKADVQFCLRSIEDKFKAKPLLVQLPLFGSGGAFAGVVDLLNMEEVEWFVSEDSSGRTFERRPLSPGPLMEEALAARQRLVEAVVDMDEELAEAVLSADCAVALTAPQLETALRRITLARTAVPVLCGSSFKNIGVQPLLDAAVSYLPSPADRIHDFVKFYGSGLCALVFKIIHDKQKGRLTFLRLYSGRLEQGQRVYNVGRRSAEKMNKLFVAYADELEEVKAATSGSIVVATGLMNVVTGDTLVASAGAAGAALEASRGQQGRGFSGTAVLAGVNVPKPVFFCSIEPSSLKYKTPLEQALECLQVEDPSFTVKTDPDTRQVIIGGMGELHIEIIKDRLAKEFKVEADLGPLQVAYQETLSGRVELRHQFERSIGKTRGQVTLDMSMEPQDDDSVFHGLQIGKGKETRENLAQLHPDQLEALEDGVRSALTSGPLLGFPVTEVSVCLHWCQLAPGTSRTMLEAAAAQCVRAMLKDAPVRLMEPVMSLEIVTERGLHGVLADLSQRRSHIVEIAARNECKVVRALTPLARLVGYSTALRIITSGMASFTVEFDSYRLMTQKEQQSVVSDLAGFA